MQTGAGKFCPSLLELYMREELYTADVHTVEVKGFGLDFEEDLVNLMGYNTIAASLTI